MKPITLKDIAIRANVSTAAVSVVLNNKSSRISQEKKDEILRIAKELDYRPNLSARALVSNETRTIGLIIPDIENPFFASLAKAIEEKLKEYNYTLILMNTNELFKNDVESINLLSHRGVDGFLIILSNEAYSNQVELFKMLDSIERPFVLVDRTFNNEKYNQVAFDDFLGQYLATSFLIERGYKKIGYIAPPLNTFNTENRLGGYLEAYKVNGLDLDKSLIKYGDYHFDGGYEATKELLSLNVDAILASNDIMAYGAIKRINEKGLNIPNSIAVVGYDDLMFSDMGIVSLTTVKQEYGKLSKSAVDLLLRSIKNTKEKENIILKPELTIRNSTL